MDLILPIAAILAIALFFNKHFRLVSAASPIFAISLITLFLCLAGMVNLLAAGVLVVYTAAVFLLVFLFVIKRYPVWSTLKEFFSAGVIFFLTGVIFFFFVLRSKNAIFRDWDEFSFWGTAAKTVFFYDKLYTYVPLSFTLSYPPALPVFSYFTQFFRSSFAEFRTYTAYDIMIAAALAPIFSRIKRKNVLAAAAAAVFSFMGIYAFFHASEGLRAYATSYSDMQIGFLFAGALLVWFSNNENEPVRYFAALILLLVITLCKDIGLAVSFIAAFIMMADMVISGNYPSDSLAIRYPFAEKAALPLLCITIMIPVFLVLGWLPAVIALLISAAFLLLLRFRKNTAAAWFRGKRRMILRITSILFIFIAVFLVYRLWAFHYLIMRGTSRDAVFRYSLLDILSGKSRIFKAVLKEMMSRLKSHSIICFGTIREMILVFTVVPVIISLFTRNKKKILRVGAFAVLLALGFMVYYVFHAYLFATQFPISKLSRSGGSIELVSFNRYISTYAIGWMYAIIGVLFLEVVKPAVKAGLLTFSAAIAISTAMIFSIFYYTPENPDQYLLTSKKVIVSESGPRSLIHKNLSRIKSEFTCEDRIYFVSFSTDGGEWFCALYEAFPALLQGELGYFISPGSRKPTLREVAIDRKGFSTYLRENMVNMVYVNYRIDDYFLEEFGPMFSDGLAYAYDDSARVYYVVDEGGEEVVLVPIIGAEQFRQLKG